MRNDLANAVHPKTPSGTSLALARPAAVLSFVLHLLINTDLLFVSCNSVQLNYNTEQCKTTKYLYLFLHFCPVVFTSSLSLKKKQLIEIANKSPSLSPSYSTRNSCQVA